MNSSDEIKQKLDIVDLIREYMPLKAVGANFQARCPFHNEKTPSFVVSPEKQIWHCFGCSRGGDIFSFVMEKEGMNFREALEFLAPKAGVELKYTDSKDRSKRRRILDILELSSKYYAHVLNNKPGESALAYLHKRGLDEENIAFWRLGYSPDSWNSLYNFLKARPKEGDKFSDEEILASGMVIKKDRFSSGNSYFDRFRGRIMFPIWDANNNIIAYTARISPEKEKTEKTAKYINSPQSEVYDKSKVLFALNHAKNAIREEDLVIVVEGQMDAIACHNNGITNVVASSGTALSAAQVSLLKRFTNNISLAFDMDEAGQNAADRGVGEILAQGLNVKIITLPGGKDPDEAIKTDLEGVKKAISEAEPMLDYYFKKVSKDLDLNVLDNKIDIRDKMFARISLISNKSNQGYWLKKISEELDFSENDIREEFVKYLSTRIENRYKPTEGKEDLANQPKKRVLSKEELLSELFLALVLKFPSLYSYAVSNLDTSYLALDLNAEFYKHLIIYYNKAGSFDYEDFHKSLGNNNDFSNLLDRLSLLGEKEFYAHEESEARKELIQLVLELKRNAFKKQIKYLEKELIVLEKSGSTETEKMTNLMQDLKSATDELKKLN